MSRCRHVTLQNPVTLRPRTLAWLAAEPFRVFFPWAALLGVAGVTLWPVFFAGWLQFQPALMHSRLMILGFGGGTVIGFLGTAAPRMLGTHALRPVELCLLLLLHAAAIGAFTRLHDELGCSLFAATLILLLLLIGGRLHRRTDLPPPAFALVVMGLACGICGTIMSSLNLDFQSAFNFRFTRLLTNEAFLLLPVLGVSGFLVPRILGLRSRQSFPDGPLPAPGWWPLLAESLLAGALIISTFALEAWGEARLGPAIRFCVIMGWWSRDAPGLWRAKAVGTQAWMLKMGLGFIAAAPLILACDPAHLIAMEHVLFITGFGLAILGVASRVIYGHSGSLPETKLVSKPFRWIVWLVVLAMSTRVSADYSMTIQNSHYIYAALTWVIIVAIWLRLVWSKLWTPDP